MLDTMILPEHKAPNSTFLGDLASSVSLETRFLALPLHSKVLAWSDLHSVATKAIARVLCISPAFVTHVDRLDDEAHLYFARVTNDEPLILRALADEGPASIKVNTLSLIKIFADADALDLLNERIKLRPTAPWKSQLKSPSANFVAGDLLDCVTEKMYHLAKLIPGFFPADDEKTIGYVGLSREEIFGTK
jgi:hypothetical protein